MKRIIRILLCAGAILTLLNACEQELPHNQKVQFDSPAKIGLDIDVDGDVELMAPKTKSYTISVKAESIADNPLTITIKVDPNKVKDYNTANGTDYEIVPADAYSISTNTLYLPRYNTQSSTSTLTLKADGMPDDGKTRLLPITLEKVEGDADLSLDAQDSTFYVKFTRMTIATIKFKEGEGTQAKPYIIRESQDMLALVNSLKGGTKVYFRMEEDVDMSDLSEWSPVNAAAPFDKEVDFDGNGHKILNFNSNAASMPSFFGVLKGSVRNLTFENASIENGTSNDGAGVLAGSAINATITDVTAAVNIKTSGNNTTGTMVGGLVGSANGCTFKNIFMKTNIESTIKNTPNFVGGMVGFCEGSKSTFENCHNEGDITGYFFTGGLVGVITPENSSMTNCSANGNITSAGRYTGGLIGYVNRGFTITDCHSEGSVSVTNAYTGGLIGCSQGELTMRKCWAATDMFNTTGTMTGGLIGNPGVKSGNSLVNDDTAYGNTIIEDCYATGNVTITAGSGTKGRMTGGLIGFYEANAIKTETKMTVNRCYASGNVSSVGSNGAIGGVIGGAVKSSGDLNVNINLTVSNCIAWNKIIDNTTTVSGYSSAAVIGAVAKLSVLSNNYRRADMEFKFRSGEDSLFDQESADDLTLTNPKCPYHGKAAPAGSTCSQVAKTLGWPEDIWDLSGEMPKLK